MGWSPIKKVKKAVSNVGGAVGDVVSGAGDIIQNVVIDPVVELGSNLEDGIREVVDEADKLVQNPYVQMVVSAINPAAGAFLNAYATLDSGENLSPAQVAALAASGYTAATGTTIPPDVQKALKAGETIASGGDVKDVLLNTYGSDFVSELGLDTRVNEALTNTIGADATQLLKDNIDYAEAAARVVSGEDPTVVIADKFGQDIVDSLGVGDPIGFAALKTAVGLDQGLDTNEALLAGGEEYYKRGGQLPDVNTIASLAGVEDFDLGVGDFVANLGIDFPELQGLGYDLPSLASLGIDLPSLGGVEVPELLSNFSLPEVADLGFDIPSLDLSGFKPTDLGYDVGTWGQLKDLGVNIGDLNLEDYNLDQLANINLDLQLPELNMFLRNQGVAPLEYGSLDMDESLLPEFDITTPEKGDELPLSQQLLRARLA